jgi:HPt (histidine-containing phosphotransfer) domain-containing protein
MSQLISIDMQTGMKYAGNNKNLYMKMVDRFYANYIDIDLTNMSSNEFERAIHNLKSISMSIGAVKLHNIAKDIDENNSIDMVPNLLDEMKMVLSDVKTLLDE